MPRPLVQSAARRAKSRSHSAAFTLLEMLVSIAIIALLATLIIGAVVRVRSSAQSVKCLANLRQIANAFHVYVADNGGKMPDPLGDAVPWETSIRPYIANTDVFGCPADQEVFPAVGSSYDWRDTGDPATSIAGQAPDNMRGDAVLTFESLPGWHSKRKINVVRMNGSAEMIDEQDCFADLTRPVQLGK
jgi:prepilin-type N-terminal cleavage/methylation domain-containing protein